MPFLGIDKASNGHFALAVTEHRTRNVPGAIEKLRPIVDLRSLAMQGIMSPGSYRYAARRARSPSGTRTPAAAGTAVALRWSRMAAGGASAGRGLEWFPRTDPVVIMLITDGERCLLAHEHRYGDKMYSALAGFIEPGGHCPCGAPRGAGGNQHQGRRGTISFESAMAVPAFAHAGLHRPRRDHGHHHRQRRARRRAGSRELTRG